MGYIARTANLSRAALGIEAFSDWFEQPAVLGVKDLPYLPPPFVPLVDKAALFVEQDMQQAQASHEAGFAARNRPDMPAWAGPPGLPENRPLVTRPEEPRGDIFSWVG